MSETQLDQLLKPLIKPAVLLSLSKSETAQAASCESKFAGLPYAEKNEVWPHCPTCQNELDFVAQIKSPAENSLQTFFYCFECFPWGSSEEEVGQWLVRSYQNPVMANYSPITSTHPPEYEIEPCTCTAKNVQTLPNWSDLESLSPEASALCREIDADEPWEAYDLAVIRNNALADYATFIGGYPKWIQSETTTYCKVCGNEMEFFAQIDSEDEADLMWGDCGAVYLFRCAEHKNEFGFELQCY
jgi:uncharacterized protein YwqG